MTVFETQRLSLRRFEAEDAEFVLALVNDPSWLRFIGDKGVRTLEQARDYIESGPKAMYARTGFGLYLVQVRETGVPVGMCGLIKRDALDDVDIGFAFLDAFRGQGYAQEAAAGTLEHGRSAYGLTRIVAIVKPDNDRSIRLLGKLGMSPERRLTLPGSDAELELFARDF